MSDERNLEFLACRLARLCGLSKRDMAAVADLPHSIRYVNPNAYLIREGEPPRAACRLVLDGMAFKHKLTADGARQIVSIHLPGDLLDLQHLFLNIADHSVQALTAIEVAEIDRNTNLQ